MIKLRVNGLSCYVSGEGWLIDGLTFSAAAGEPFYLRELSYAAGCVLADCIVGRRKPEQGTIILEDEALSKAEVSEVRGLRLTIADRSTALLSYLTLRENLMLVQTAAGRKAYREDAEKARRKVLESLDLFRLEYRLPGRLSSLERDRAKLAMALLTQPDLLVINGLPSDTSIQGQRAFKEDVERVCMGPERIVLSLCSGSTGERY